VDRRKKNADWLVYDKNGNCWQTAQYGSIQVALLMDIRDELQKLNRVFECRNFLSIPDTLMSIRANAIVIAKNTKKAKRKRKKV